MWDDWASWYVCRLLLGSLFCPSYASWLYRTLSVPLVSQMVHDCALVPGSSRIHDFFCYAFPPNMRCLLCCMFVRTVTIWNNYYLKASNVDTVPDIMEISLVSCDLLWSTGTTNRSYMFRPLLARSVDGKRMIAALGMLQRLWLFAPETICRQ